MSQSARSGWRPLVNTTTGAVPQHSTEVRFAWQASERILDIEVQSLSKFLHSPFRRRNEPLHQADVVEVFLDPLGGGRIYREIEVSPAGVLFDAWILNTTRWSAGAERQIRAAFEASPDRQAHAAVKLDQKRPSDHQLKMLQQPQGLAVELWQTKIRVPWPQDWSAPHGNVFRMQRVDQTNSKEHLALFPTGPFTPQGIVDFHRPQAFQPLLDGASYERSES